MAISLKHLFQSAKTDGPDNTIVQPSDWNDEHVLTQATGKLLGRTTAGTGATEEIAPGTGITLSAGTLSADVTSVAGRTGAVTLSTADISGLTTGYVQKTSATGSAYLPAGTTGQREGSPSAGYIRYNTTTGKFEGYGSSWGNIGGGASIGDTPPANPGAGDLWWNSADGRMYVYYTDANSSQWVDLSAGGAGQYLPLTGGDVTGNVTVTGNFGIGTNSPTRKLDVFASGTTTVDFAVRNNTVSLSSFVDSGAGYVGTSTNHPAIFLTNNTERMRIDTSGRVTMPYQPAFSAINGGSSQTAGVIQYGALTTNTGGHYNSSTYRFTAPVAGVYFFVASTIGTTGNAVSIYIRKNGTRVSGVGWGGTTTGNESSTTINVICNLAVGDYVDVYTNSSLYNSTYGNFCGHLIG